MSLFGDIWEQISGLFDFSNENKQAKELPTEAKPPTITPENSLIKTNPSQYTSIDIEPPAPSQLSPQAQASAKEISNFLKEYGIGAPRHIGSLDLSLPDNIGHKDISSNIFTTNQPIDEKAQHTIAFLDSPATQAAFNFAALDYRKTGNTAAFEQSGIVQQLIDMFADGITDTSAQNLLIEKFKQTALNKGDPAKLLSAGYKNSIFHQGMNFEVSHGINGKFDIGADWTAQGQLQGGIKGSISF